tara:strand:+ start:300 stop:539 length:240 start_codon:yes stop_codon:yes gene_type:complete
MVHNSKRYNVGDKVELKSTCSLRSDSEGFTDQQWEVTGILYTGLLPWVRKDTLVLSNGSTTLEVLMQGDKHFEIQRVED